MRQENCEAKQSADGERQARGLPRRDSKVRYRVGATRSKILNAALHNRVLSSITQGQKCNCRIVRVRCKGSSIDDSVPGVPSSARAGTIEQHLDATLNAERDLFQNRRKSKGVGLGQGSRMRWEQPS